VSDLLIKRSAYFPVAGIRRRLSRDWEAGPRACVIGHNPSTADAEDDDPTTKWMNRWFATYGFGGYDLVNLYPFCTPDPAECYRIAARAWQGPDWHNRDEILHNITAVGKLAKRAAMVFVCWGAIARDDVLIEQVVEEIQTGTMPYPALWCWGKTKAGAPTHPMARGKHRIAPDVYPIVWRAA
jgi:hypothetical protein